MIEKYFYRSMPSFLLDGLLCVGLFLKRMFFDYSTYLNRYGVDKDFEEENYGNKYIIVCL